MRPAWDVVVVGAGPAGSVAARGLAREGLRVLLVDGQRFPRRKVCGACVGPGARERLRREGLEDVVRRLGPVELGVLELRAGTAAAEIALEGQWALTRARLDSGLVDAAVEAGVTFRDRVAVRSVAPERGRAGGVSLETSAGALRARVVVDAAGLRGIAPRRRATDPRRGAPPGAGELRVAPEARIGLGGLLRDDPSLPRGVLRMVAGRDGYVGLVRTEDGSVNVAAALAPDVVAERGPLGAVQADVGIRDVSV